MSITGSDFGFREMLPVVIRSRLGEYSGMMNDEIAYFDRFDRKADRIVRHYILLDLGVKLMYEPWGWQREWYADMVKVEYIDSETIELRDQYVDVIIEQDGPTYRIIDLEDLAEKLKIGEIEAGEVGDVLRRLEEFLDTHLHMRKDFPPKVICRHILPS